MARTVEAGGVKFGGRSPLALIAGPCVIESREGCLALADKLCTLARKKKIPFVFKASYDKANRTSIESYRGPGLVKGLEILAEIKQKHNVPILTDVHSEQEVPLVAGVADILQIPAFLCRQTDLLVAAGESGRVVNIKKGQFLAPGDMRHVVDKVRATGNQRIILTERGVSFGYNTLVADMRSLLILREMGCPVVFDCTHSVQSPGGAGASSGGDGKYAPYLAKAAVAVGVDGVFLETHLNPEEALSDKANAIPFSRISRLWDTLNAIDEVKG